MNAEWLRGLWLEQCWPRISQSDPFDGFILNITHKYSNLSEKKREKTQDMANLSQSMEKQRTN